MPAEDSPKLIMSMACQQTPPQLWMRRWEGCRCDDVTSFCSHRAEARNMENVQHNNYFNLSTAFSMCRRSADGSNELFKPFPLKPSRNMCYQVVFGEHSHSHTHEDDDISPCRCALCHVSGHIAVIII